MAKGNTITLNMPMGNGIAAKVTVKLKGFLTNEGRSSYRTLSDEERALVGDYLLEIFAAKIADDPDEVASLTRIIAAMRQRTGPTMRG